MIDFTTVAREIRSLVSRRRNLLTFLGSVFAAMGIVLQNMLQGGLPESLKSLEGHVFASYALMLMVPSLILALRLARLNAGMVLNGVLYQRLMGEQDFTTRTPPERIGRAARLNYFGVSFLMFLLAALIAGFSATLLALALSLDMLPAVLIGSLVIALWVLLYHLYHNRAATFGLQKISADSCAPFDRDQWEAHLAGSLEDINQDMIAVLGLVGLMVFSGFEGLSGLGRSGKGADLPSEQVQEYGPAFYGVLMTSTCLMGLITYLRLRLAVGAFSLLIDPGDRPFRPFRLTDSLLGYLLLAFLLAVSLHVLLFPRLKNHVLLFGIDAALLAVALLVEQLALVIAGRRAAAACPPPPQLGQKK